MKYGMGNEGAPEARAPLHSPPPKWWSDGTCTYGPHRVILDADGIIQAVVPLKAPLTWTQRMRLRSVIWLHRWMRRPR